jgi:hypothetical protein
MATIDGKNIFYKAIKNGNYKKAKRIYKMSPSIISGLDIAYLFTISLTKNVGTFILLSKLFNFDIYHYGYDLTYMNISVLEYILQIKAENLTNFECILPGTNAEKKFALLKKYKRLDRKLFERILHSSIVCYNFPQFKFVLEYFDIDGKIILFIFMEDSSVSMMKYIINLVIDQNIVIKNKEFIYEQYLEKLYINAKYLEYDILDFTLSNKKCLKGSTVKGNTIVHFACKNKDKQLLNYLMSRFGVNAIKNKLYVPNYKNKNAIEYIKDDDLMSLFEVLTKPSLSF